MSNLVSKKIQINTEFEQPVYQRESDKFFCLSQACFDIGQYPSKFLNYPGINILFLRYGKHKPKDVQMQVKKLAENYPDLIYYDRSSRKIESGIWLHKLFLPYFEEWCQNRKKQNWDKYLGETSIIDRIYEVPVYSYAYLMPSLVEKVRQIWIREADGFIRGDSLQNFSVKNFTKLFNQRSFITTLETAVEKLGLKLDYDLLNEQSLVTNERIYRLYQPLYDYQIIEGEHTIWLHPELAMLLDRSYQIPRAIHDWEQRTVKHIDTPACYITQIHSHHLTADKFAKADELASFRVTDCLIELYDAEDLIGLKITHDQSHWQFFLCLDDRRIYISNNLVAHWNQKPNEFKSSQYYAEEELSAARHQYTTLERLLEKQDTLCMRDCKVVDESELSKTYLYYQSESIHGYHRILIDPVAAKTINYLLKIVNQNFQQTDDFNEVRLQLVKMGYTSPLLIESLTKQEEYKTIKFGDISVRQRLRDGFVSANDFYRPFGKKLSDWLKNDSTFKFFKAIAKKEQLIFNCDKNSHTVYTRVSACFPDLIERKSGSPEVGGGTWIHPLIALNLAQSVSSEYAAQVVYILRDYYVNKALMKSPREIVASPSPNHNE